VSTTIENVACPFCGCLCDDLKVETEDNEILKVKLACSSGQGIFMDYDPRSRLPLVDGREVEWDEAVAEAASILRAGRTVARRRGEARSRRERHDPQPVRAHMKQPAGRSCHRCRSHDDRGRVADLLSAQSSAEAGGGAGGERARDLPWRKVQQGDHDWQARRDGQRSGSDGVVDGARSTLPFSAPGRTQRGTAEQERIQCLCRGTQPAGRRQQAAPDDLDSLEMARGVIQVRAQQEREGLAREQVGLVRIQERSQVCGRDGRTVRVLKRPKVQNDAEPGRRRPDGRRLAEGHDDSASPEGSSR